MQDCLSRCKRLKARTAAGTSLKAKESKGLGAIDVTFRDRCTPRHGHVL